jgi:hypothetical protein
MRACSGPGTCPGCLLHAALQSRDGDEIRKKLMLLWEGRPVKATSYQELMRALNISEAEARELEYQEQIIVDQEVARFPRSVHQDPFPSTRYTSLVWAALHLSSKTQ